MKHILNKIEYNKKIVKRKFEKFSTGDILEVKLWITEGSKKRIQSFEGIVISIHKNNYSSTFTIRKISYGEGVERVFLLYSPLIDSITIKRRGMFKKSKLYYIRKKRKI